MTKTKLHTKAELRQEYQPGQPRPDDETLASRLIVDTLPDPPAARSVIAYGVRTRQIVVDRGGIQLSPDASPQFVGELAAVARVSLPSIPIDPPLAGWQVSDFIFAVVETSVREYLRIVAAATAAIEAKIAQVGNMFGQPVGGIDFGGPDLSIAFRKYEFGAIYLIPNRGTFEVHGDIYRKYAALGAETGFLGFPASDELATTSGRGRFNHFERGSIYWSPASGAWSLRGPLLIQWWSMSSDMSYLGFPVSDVEPHPDPAALATEVAYFQRGRLEHGANGVVRDSPDAVMLQVSIEAGTVKATADFWMNARGDWRYFGHFHNAGFAGCVALIATSPKFQDAAGHMFAVTAERSLGGTLDSEDRNDDWDDFGNEAFLRDNWDFVRWAGISTTLQTDTTIGDVLAMLAKPFVAAVVIIGASLFLKGKKICPPHGSIHRELDGSETRIATFPVVDENEKCPEH